MHDVMTIQVSEAAVKTAYNAIVRDAFQEEINKMFVTALKNINTNHVDQVEVIQKMIEYAASQWSIPEGSFLPSAKSNAGNDKYE